MKKINKNLVNVYCDMDGVIADFNGEPNALERFKTEKGFFKGLAPINSQGFRKLIEADGKKINLFILSSSPNRQADKDKKAWLKFFYPQVKRVIFCRNGDNKAFFRKTEQGILLDDYGRNCREWRADGNKAIKIEGRLVDYVVNELGL